MLCMMIKSFVIGVWCFSMQWNKKWGSDRLVLVHLKTKQSYNLDLDIYLHTKEASARVLRTVLHALISKFIFCKLPLSHCKQSEATIEMANTTHEGIGMWNITDFSSYSCLYSYLMKWDFFGGKIPQQHAKTNKSIATLPSNTSLRQMHLFLSNSIICIQYLQLFLCKLIDICWNFINFCLDEILSTHDLFSFEFRTEVVKNWSFYFSFN